MGDTECGVFQTGCSQDLGLVEFNFFFQFFEMSKWQYIEVKYKVQEKFLIFNNKQITLSLIITEHFHLNGCCQSAQRNSLLLGVMQSHQKIPFPGTRGWLGWLSVGSGHAIRVLGSSPTSDSLLSGECAFLFPSLSPIPHALSQINKYNFLKNLVPFNFSNIFCISLWTTS